MFDVMTLKPPHSQYSRAVLRGNTKTGWSVYMVTKSGWTLAGPVFESRSHNKCQVVGAEINRYLNARARLRGENV